MLNIYMNTDATNINCKTLTEGKQIQNNYNLCD